MRSTGIALASVEWPTVSAANSSARLLAVSSIQRRIPRASTALSISRLCKTASGSTRTFTARSLMTRSFNWRRASKQERLLQLRSPQRWTRPQRSPNRRMSQSLRLQLRLRDAKLHEFNVGRFGRQGGCIRQKTDIVESYVPTRSHSTDITSKDLILGSEHVISELPQKSKIDMLLRRTRHVIPFTKRMSRSCKAMYFVVDCKDKVRPLVCSRAVMRRAWVT